MGRTIRKNALKLQEKIFSSARNATVHTLDNKFSGQRVSIANAKSSYRSSRTAYLYYNGSGKYRIHFHSNKFIKFQSVPPPPIKKRKPPKKKKK